MNLKYLVLFSILLISSTVQAQPFGSGGVQYMKPTGYLNESVGSRYYEIKCNVGEIAHVLHKPKSNSGEVINQWLTGDQRQVLAFYAGATTEGFAQAACGIVSNAQSRVPNEAVRSSSSTVSSNANAPLATLDGNWYSSQWKYGYVLKDGVGVATSTNSPNFQVGQSIIRLTATSSTTFVGQQVYTDGKFYQVNAKLQTDGRLYFEGEKNVKWVMERIGAPPQVASPTRPAQGSVKEITDEAVRLIRDKNYTNAEQLLRPLVAANNGYAQYLLGHIYESAPPPLRNYVTAVELYTKSANQGFLVAMHALGLAYDNARGVVKDEAYAIEMYAKAAGKNFGRSQYALGLKYAQGSGVEKNLDQAIDLLQKAANQNVAGAQQSLDQVRAAKQNAPSQSTARVDNSSFAVTNTSALTAASQSNESKVEISKDFKYIPKLNSQQIHDFIIEKTFSTSEQNQILGVYAFIYRLAKTVETEPRQYSDSGWISKHRNIKQYKDKIDNAKIEIDNSFNSIAASFGLTGAQLRSAFGIEIDEDGHLRESIKSIAEGRLDADNYIPHPGTQLRKTDNTHPDTELAPKVIFDYYAKWFPDYLKSKSKNLTDVAQSVETNIEQRAAKRLEAEVAAEKRRQWLSTPEGQNYQAEQNKIAIEKRRIADENMGKEYPFYAIISCGMNQQHINVLACFAGRSGTELELRNGTNYGMYKAHEITGIGQETPEGLLINLRKNFSLKVQNSSDQLILGVKIIERATNKVVFIKQAATYQMISIGN
ncbi:Sel1-like repeat [Burkholderiaceae bacterium]